MSFVISAIVINNSSKPSAFVAEGQGNAQIKIHDEPVWQIIKNRAMKKTDADIQNLRELIRKGLDLTFKKLLTQKKAQNGFLVLSENGQIKKVSAAEISN